MNDDISIGLLEMIQKSFNLDYNQSTKIESCLKKLEQKKADYATAQEYAIEVGEILAKAFGNIQSSDLPKEKMYYNIAKKLIEPTLTKNYELINDYSMSVQIILNKSANISLATVSSKINQEQIEGIINKVSIAKKYDDVSWMLEDPIVQFTQNVVDRTIKANANMHYYAGITATIKRKVFGKACPWCMNLAGIYVYPDVPDDVYHRHNNCRCQVTYDPADGKRRGVQDVWSKKWEKESANNRRKKLIIKDEAFYQADRLINEAKKKDQKITTVLKRIADKGQGSLEGLNHRIKSKESLIRKLESKSKAKNISIKECAEKITDVLRYTNVSDPNYLVKDYFNFVDSFIEEGYNFIEVKNTFGIAGPYKGINTLVSDNQGYIFELQFHTPQSLEIKEINHKLYEEWRLDTTSEKRKKELAIEMKKNAEEIKIPESVDKIKDKQ